MDTKTKMEIWIQDSEGVEIKEGDILVYPKDGHKVKVEYKNDEFMVYQPQMDEYWDLDSILNSFGSCPYKIIGNFHDNPELLNKEGA